MSTKVKTDARFATGKSRKHDVRLALRLAGRSWYSLHPNAMLPVIQLHHVHNLLEAPRRRNSDEGGQCVVGQFKHH